MNAPSATPTPATQALDVAIGGMSCGHCVAAVREALADLPGVDVRQVAVGSASVALDPRVASPDAVLQAIRDAGYEPSVAGRALPQAAAGSCCSTRQS